MRIALGVVGLISCVLVIFGSMFKIQQWPGGGVMVVLGATLFAKVFSILYCIYLIQNRKNPFDVLYALVLTFTMWCLTIGLLFKVQHWPGSGPLLVLGLTLLGGFCLPVFMFAFINEKRYKEGLNNLGLVIALAAISMVMAMRTGKEVTSGFVTNHQLLNHGSAIMNGLVLKMGQTVAPANAEKAERIARLSADMYQMLENYKTHLIRETAQLEPSEPAELSDLFSVDNYDRPTNILIGGDPGSPRTDEWSAMQLKEALATYAQAMVSESGSEENAAMVTRLFSQEPLSVAPDETRAWEDALFYHMPLGSVVSSLSVLQNSVLVSQALLLNELTQGQVDTAGVQP